MTTATYATTTRIKINGTALSEARMNRLNEVTVEQSVHLPDMFLLSFDDANGVEDRTTNNAFNLIDSDAFPIGAEVEIELGNPLATVLKGEITGIELDIGDDGVPTVTARGYARSHRLHRGRQTRSFMKMKDSDLAAKIATEAGLTAKADATSQQHEYLYQNNQTNWEFLRERAARIGYELFVDDRNLYFRKPQRGLQTGPKLVFGENLSSFRVTVSTAQQAAEVEVRGWDPTKKTALVGTASSGAMAPQLGWGKTGKQLSSSFGTAKVSVVNLPIATQDEATTLAKAIYDNLDGAFIQAEGACEGDPGVKPGTTIEVSKVGTHLSGKYYVASATHRFSLLGGYETAFTVSGRQSDSMLELIAARREGGALPAVVVGVVTDNTDKDDNLGRVKVKFPWLAESDQSAWARIASPMAGNQRGFFFLPEVNDEVLVAFEQGDITRPYILGALWNGVDKPPKANSTVVANSKVNERMIKTRSGHVISLDDTENAEKIVIQDKTGKNLIQIESASNKITIQAEAEIALTSKGKVTVSSTQDTSIEVKGNATIKGSQNVDVTAQGHANVSAGTSASVKAQTALELKGATINIEAQSAMTVKANGPLTLKGAVVNIN